MRITWILLAMAILAGGCSSKNMRVSGMICPAGLDENRIQSDFRSCRAYSEKEAEKATYPKRLSQECQECLVKRGYEIER